jgi:SnoaL-like domain
MPITDLSPTALQRALARYELLFAEGDVEAILEDFADDVRVRYGSLLPFTGKERLRATLRRRFASMRDYRLSKRLEFVCPPRYAASWTGSWIETATGARMEVFGLELLTVRDGKFVEWSASVSVWRFGEAGSVPALAARAGGEIEP